MTLPHTVNETLKWLTSLPILVQKSFWRCSLRYKLPPPSYLLGFGSLALLITKVAQGVKLIQWAETKGVQGVHSAGLAHLRSCS